MLTSRLGRSEWFGDNDMSARLLVIAGAAIAMSASQAKAQDYYYGQPRQEPRERPYEAPREHEFGREEFPGDLHGLHAACERGDREACIRFGWTMHERRQHHAEWRRRWPEYFWWDQR